MCSVVFAPRGVVPFDSQPLALLVCHLTDITDSACLVFQTQSLAYVRGGLGHDTSVFRVFGKIVES